MTHPHPNRKFVSQAVLTRSGKINTAGASVNTAVRPVNTASSKPTVNHPRSITNAYKKDIHKSQGHLTSIQQTRTGNPQQKEYKEKGVIDSGCSRHMTGTNAILTDKKIKKDETSGILKTFITEIENQLDHKVKVIRSDNGTELKNSVMNQFCEMKEIKREFNVARTPQQNGVAERKNRTLIEAARTMDHLGKFDGKADEGFFVGYSVQHYLVEAL
ncbi:ribonuclease H-like domain-containing protein [Tanacetum coccineum]